MIVKYFELEKLNLQSNNLFLLYGKNDGLKEETINKLFKNKKIPRFNYDEKEILENADIFLENLFSQSLFETEKIIIIKRTTDKILKIVEKIIDRKVHDTKIFFNSDNLEKKSKLRLFFEKDKKCSCTPFYPDDEKTLSKFAHNSYRSTIMNN